MVPAAAGSVAVRFVSGKDGKDNDTHLTVSLNKTGGTQVAEVDGQDFAPFGTYNPGDTTNLTLPLTAQFTTADLPGSYLDVHIDPNGSDHWDFDCYITIIFSDGTTFTNSFLSHWLDENRRDNTYILA